MHMQNKNPLTNYLYNSHEVMSFYQYAMRLGFWPDYPDEKNEELSRHMETAGVSDTRKIDQLLIDNKELLRNYLSHIYSKRKNTWRVTPEFLCALILIARSVDSFSTNLLMELGWEEEIASIVIDTARLFRGKLAIT